MSFPLIATLESGGTKMVAALARGPQDILIREVIPTTTPQETISRLVEFFNSASSVHGAPEALAVGSFGPADLDPASPTYGSITTTPKGGWSHTDLLGPLNQALGNLPTVFETDVAASLAGEVKWGAAKDLKHAAYFTIGTGIGGALLINGEIIHGNGHSEMGHMSVKRHPDDQVEGVCPFHKDCLEGLASGPALKARWQMSAEEIPPSHIAWEMQAGYLAQACLNLLVIAPPQRIILGGGVMHQRQLYPLIRQQLAELVNGYLALGDLDALIVPPALGDNAALLGCVALGQQQLS